MGDAQSPIRPWTSCTGALRASRARAVRTATDFTVAVEEEFAVLDPETLELTNRFEDLQAAAKGPPLEEHLVGELIASEVEVRTGRCERLRRSRGQDGRAAGRSSTALAEPLGIALGGTGTHPWSSLAGPAHHRHAALPPERRDPPATSSGGTTPSGSTCTRRSAAPIARSRCDALRNYLPELLALSASSPFVEGVDAAPLGAHGDLHARMFPRCGVPDAFESWDEYERFVRFLYDTGSIDEHTQIWWSVRPHLAFPTVEVRICDGQPDLEEARSLAALMYSLTVRVARALDEGEPLPAYPHRLIEENLWRAIRFGLGGEMIELSSGRVRSTRRAVEELIEWSLPAAEETGAASYLRVPDANAAERQIARHESGARPRGDLRRAGAPDAGAGE